MQRFLRGAWRRFGLRSSAVHALWLVPGAAALLLACGDDPGGAGAGGSSASGGSGASSGGGGSSASGGSGASGGSSASGGAGAGGGSAGSAAAGGSGGSAGGNQRSLSERISVSTIQVPAGVAAGDSNWRIWGRGSLHVAPVFATANDGGGMLVCYTTEAGAAVLVKDRLETETSELAKGRECRGLAKADDGGYAALLWDDAGDRIFLHRYDAKDQLLGVTELTNPDNKPDDFGIGESRLEYGDGRYGAYYHVHSDSGHEGDTLKWVDATTGAETTGWGWGCSHSMSNLLRYNPALNGFMPACVTDCFPGTTGDFATNSQGGIYLNHNKQKVLDVAAGCNGSVAGELGSAALAPDGYKLVFNAHQAPLIKGQQGYDASTMNQDIGFVSIGADLSPGAVVWLTDTPGINEADASIAHFRYTPTPGATDVEQYLVGWAEPGATYKYWLGRIDAGGAWLEGPVDVSNQVSWGRRADPFRESAGGVTWAWFDAPGSTALHIAQVDDGFIVL